MQKRRVVITGMGSVSPYGYGNKALQQGIESGTTPFIEVEIKTSKTKHTVFPVGLVPKIDEELPREVLRTMSNLSIYVYYATLEALRQAGLTQQSFSYKHIGTSISSSLASIEMCGEIFEKYFNINPKDMPSTLPFKTLNHSSAFNIAVNLGLMGRCISSSSACAGGLQSIALGYEAIAYNKSNVMVCGGTEEYHPFLTLIFNKLGIASREACKPFDTKRNGIIVSEGAGILVLEERKHAIERGATIYAEILGSGMNISPNISYSDTDSIIDCMKEASIDACILFHSINLVNAHATGTDTGDIAEGKAIEQLLPNTMTNALKGYYGHTMGACGAIETISTILGLNKGKFYATKNCNTYDSNCGKIDFTNELTNVDIYSPIVLKNSFGLGGTNTTLIFQAFNKGE
jgi:3-oxoacyl-[acyl-carrier-protein] synthase II